MNEKIFKIHKIKLPNIMPKKSGPEKQKKRKKFIQLIMIIFIAFTFAYFVLQAIKPIMEQQCKSMAKSISTKICNAEATEVMKRYQYEDLFIITKDDEGNVKMVGTNVITINEIISDIPIRIQEQLEKSENNNFDIRLGSFLGSNLFAGRGPNINIKMEVVGSLDTDLRSEFTSAGINQTLHRVYLEIKCNVVILTPFETIEDEIFNQVLLAEGVIIGNVPSSYYNLEGMTTDNAIDIIE